MDPPANYIMQEDDVKRKKSFKGATFLTLRWSFPFIRHYMDEHYNQMLGAGPFLEFGLGAEYMKKLSTKRKRMTWKPGSDFVWGLASILR